MRLRPYPGSVSSRHTPVPPSSGRRTLPAAVASAALLGFWVAMAAVQVAAGLIWAAGASNGSDVLGYVFLSPVADVLEVRLPLAFGVFLIIGVLLPVTGTEGVGSVVGRSLIAAAAGAVLAMAVSLVVEAAPAAATWVVTGYLLPGLPAVSVPESAVGVVSGAVASLPEVTLTVVALRLWLSRRNRGDALGIGV